MLVKMLHPSTIHRSLVPVYGRVLPRQVASLSQGMRCTNVTEKIDCTDEAMWSQRSLDRHCNNSSKQVSGAVGEVYKEEDCEQQKRESKIFVCIIGGAKLTKFWNLKSAIVDFCQCVYKMTRSTMANMHKHAIMEPVNQMAVSRWKHSWRQIQTSPV